MSRPPIGEYALDQQKLESETSSQEMTLLRDANDLELDVHSVAMAYTDLRRRLRDQEATA